MGMDRAEKDALAQRAVEQFTEAVWRAAPLGRMTLIEIVSRFFEDQAVIRQLESRGQMQFRKDGRTVDKGFAEEKTEKRAMSSGAAA